MQKYYAKKERLAGKERLCECGSRLSMYSSDSICTLCQLKKKREKTVNAKEAIRNAIVKTSKSKSR
jgi:hypothetical protein